MQKVERYMSTEPTMCGVAGSGSLACDALHEPGTVMVRSLRPAPDGSPKPSMCGEAYDRVYPTAGTVGS